MSSHSPHIRGPQIADQAITDAKVSDTAGIQEKKVSFDPTQGHTHDGVNSALVSGGTQTPRHQLTIPLAGTNVDTWTGTTTLTGLTTTMTFASAVQCPASGGTFIWTITAVRAGAFDWKLEAFKGYTSSVESVIIHYSVGN
jgi:hypothetical protein